MGLLRRPTRDESVATIESGVDNALALSGSTVLCRTPSLPLFERYILSSTQ